MLQDETKHVNKEETDIKIVPQVGATDVHVPSLRQELVASPTMV